MRGEYDESVTTSFRHIFSLVEIKSKGASHVHWMVWMIIPLTKTTKSEWEKWTQMIL